VDYRKFDDVALLRLIVSSRKEKTSDTGAVSELYDRYSRLVYSLAYFIVGEQGTAEEIMQDVFLRIWEKADTYRQEQARVNTWISSVTRNRAIDVLRSRGAKINSSSIAWDESAHNLLPDDHNTEAQVEQRMQQDRVRRAIKALSDEQQDVLRLAFFQGLSHSEIAEATRIPLGTVKTRIRTGMQRLREILDQEEIPASF
jgi:RNA polymerase sigma-70 factor (ECF subfamily)